MDDYYSLYHCTPSTLLDIFHQIKSYLYLTKDRTLYIYVPTVVYKTCAFYLLRKQEREVDGQFWTFIPE
jgi:hypothetical protein